MGLVAHLVLWYSIILVIVLFLITPIKDTNIWSRIFSKCLPIAVIPIFLSIIAIIAVLGPLSSYSVSKISQNNRFKNILIINNMLKDNKIIKASKEVSTKDKTEINNIINYFEGNHSLKDMKFIPKDFVKGDMDSKSNCRRNKLSLRIVTL